MSETTPQSVKTHSAGREHLYESSLIRNTKPSRYVGAAIPVVLFLMSGILLDRWLDPDWEIWLLCSFLSAALWLIFFLGKLNEYSLHALLGCCLFLGGAHHHCYWSVSRTDHIASFASDKSQLVRLSGTIESPPLVVSKKQGQFQSAFLRPDQTKCRVRCRSIRDGERIVPVSGTVQLSVSGHLLHVEPGDTVEIQGWLVRPRTPMNPSDYDFTDFYRRHGMRAILYTEHPEAVKNIDSPRGFAYQRFIGRVRNIVEFQFSKYLREDNVQFASALLLGRRTGLDDEMRTAFATSGTMHFLAISGLHVGILAGLLWGICRLFNAAPSVTTCVVVLVLAGYALVAESRPPVIRATIMIVILVMGRPWYRQAPSGHLLALAALCVLVLNPTDLFDIGAQLSFLSMVAIIWSGKVGLGNRARNFADEYARHSRFRRRVSYIGKNLLRVYFMAATIWIFNLPLLVSHFHIVSPVGLLLNVLLCPLLFVVLGVGHLFFVSHGCPCCGDRV